MGEAGAKRALHGRQLASFALWPSKPGFPQTSRVSRATIAAPKKRADQLITIL
jgi:hypothetical protein